MAFSGLLLKPVKTGNDVWIGENVVINPGITIGNVLLMISLPETLHMDIQGR